MHRWLIATSTIVVALVLRAPSFAAGLPGNADRCGLYDPAAGVFYPNASLTGVALLSPPGGVRFGPVGAIPLAGDFWATGHATFAAYLPPSSGAIGRLYRATSLLGGLPVILRNGEPTEPLFYANPVVGDRTDNGYDEGWSVPNPWRMTVLHFGDLGWIPFVGDWDGDGIDTPGIYDPETGNFYFNTSYQFGDVLNPAGTPFGPVDGVIPIVGDWDGDGDDTIGVFDQVTNTFYYSDDLYGGSLVDPAGQTWGAAGWLPFCGDFDGPAVTVP